MASIQAAEQQLSQNNQDVAVYRSIREELKDRRRNGHVTVKQPRDDEESFHSEHTHQLPDLRKAATSTCSRTSRSLAKHSRALKEEERSESDKASQRSHSMPGRRTRRTQAAPKKAVRFAEDEQEVQQHQNHYISARQKPAIHPTPSMDVQHPLDACANIPSLQKCSLEGLLLLENPRPAGQGNGECREVKRKRGRPRKDAAMTQQQVPKSTIQSVKHKPIHKETSKKVPFAVPHVKLSREDELIILEARQYMGNRNQLINYLITTTLSTTNVLQLLDLGVVEVLQEGAYCRRAEEACDRLKDLLFRKYFPNDFKPKPVPDRKVYRKKKSGRTVREEEKSELQPIMNAEECRKKTIAKLHKFLMRQSNSQSAGSGRPTAKEASVQIEAAFFQLDSTMGDSYKSLALKVLGALKEGTEDGATVLQKLRGREYSA